jgi:hypothetical protein
MIVVVYQETFPSFFAASVNLASVEAAAAIGATIKVNPKTQKNDLIKPSSVLCLTMSPP